MYRTILVDPPWPKKKTGSLLADRKFKSAEQVYPVMSIEQIKAMPINYLAEVGCHLWLWSTNGMLPFAFEVLKAWDFKYHAPIVWNKNSGSGNYFIHCTEFMLFAYKQKCIFNAGRYKPNNYHWKREKVHSRKPEGSYQLVESISDPARLEIFARQERSGWDIFGNEVESDVQINTSGVIEK